MELQAANNAFFQEGTQLRFLKDIFQPLDKSVAFYRTIGTPLWAKTGLNLIPLDLIPHTLQITLLGGFYFVQCDHSLSSLFSVLFNPGADPFSHKERDLLDCGLSLW
jgi:hypothetical protein